MVSQCCVFIYISPTCARAPRLLLSNNYQVYTCFVISAVCSDRAQHSSQLTDISLQSDLLFLFLCYPHLVAFALLNWMVAAASSSPSANSSSHDQNFFPSSTPIQISTSNTSNNLSVNINSQKLVLNSLKTINIASTIKLPIITATTTATAAASSSPQQPATATITNTTENKVSAREKKFFILSLSIFYLYKFLCTCE